MRPSGNVRVQKAQRIFDAELKRAFAVSGFVGTFCVVAATFTSFYISSAAALTVAFGFCSVTGCLFIIFNALGKKIAKIFLAAFIGVISRQGFSAVVGHDKPNGMLFSVT